jgi:uncharacterized protein (UPF0261 family)
MSKKTPKRLAPFTMRLTPQKRQKLERWANDAGMSLAGYVKYCIFDRGVSVPKARGKNPSKDEKALAQILAMLGESKIASSLNQLAEAAESGSLPVNLDTEAAIKVSYAAIIEMRSLLIKALGLEG